MLTAIPASCRDVPAAHASAPARRDRGPKASPRPGVRVPGHLQRRARRALRSAHYASSMASEPEQRVAIIDLGSNSFRMVVFACAEQSWRREDECSAAVRIGEGLAASGRLGEEAMGRALGTLDMFAERCKRLGLDQYTIDAVATSAIREASNGGAFLDRVRLRTGIDVRVLSREQEARYGYLAAVNSTTLTDGCVLDLGGGSLQLVRVAGRLARESGSWRLGAVRMTERFLTGEGPAKRSQSRRCRRTWRASSSARHGSRSPARGSWGWVARCATSPPPPSGRRVCLPRRCRGS